MANSAEESKELKSLKTIRASIKGQITKLVNFVNNVPDKNDIENFYSSLNRAKELLTQFCQTEQKIIEIDPDQVPQIVDISENFYEIESKLSKLIRVYKETHDQSISLNSTVMNASCSHFANQNELKLPDLEIPHFNGEYRKWQPFYDFFVKTIHDNPSLSHVQKFKYLKSSLKGKAETVLRHISITEANYIESFKKLCARFDRKKYIMNDFIENFINQSSIKIATPENIRELMDNSDETIRGLKGLGKEGESRDPWLLFILISKLDDDSKSLWAQETAQTDFPTLKQFFDFMLKRYDTLESLKSCHQSTVNQYKTKPQLKAHVGTVQESSSSGYASLLCSLCKINEHKLDSCPEFLKMDLKSRRQYIKSSNRCFNCLNKNHSVYKCMIRKRCLECNKKHHVLVHSVGFDLPSTQAHLTLTSQESNEVNENESGIHTTNAFHSNVVCQPLLIPTALVQIYDSNGDKHKCRVLLDSAALASFISESCVQRLKAQRKNGRMSVCGLDNVKVGSTRGAVNLNLTPLHKAGPIMEVTAYILPKITSKLPNQAINRDDFSYLRNLDLADPYFNIPGDIDMLLSVQHFLEILEPGQMRGNSKQPIAQKTSLGWIVGGSIPEKINNVNTLLTKVVEVDIDKALQKFWEIEEIQRKPQLTDSEQLCEQHFVKHLEFNSHGRAIVKLPFKESTLNIGDSLPLAISRLRAVERRFEKDEVFKALYMNFMLEYETLGHMQEVQPQKLHEKSYYLPHHGVLKMSSTTTKLRVVFDASAKSSSGLSLNDHLLIGATVQSSLYNILVRFRKHQIVFAADVEKMYRQILIHPDHHNFQRIVWRANRNEQIKHYQLLTVTYGTSSAPYLATRTLKELANQNSFRSPKASKIIMEDIYVDDLMSGADNSCHAIELSHQIISIFNKASMKLRKWISNSPQLISTIAEETRENTMMTIEEENTSSVKLLGIQWNPSDDTFRFNVHLKPDTKITKRIFLSEASQIFDPLGWLAPCTVAIKILFQGLWLKPIGWDDELPLDISSQWIKMKSELKQLEVLKIRRWLNTYSTEAIELHGFSDASEKAYAAGIYSRVKLCTGEWCCTLISAKTRVAPIKQISLARLELCGAVLLIKLLEDVIEALGMKMGKMYAWTDSTIVLDWLSDHPKRWQTFIGNRTSQILQVLSRENWNHISSCDNPVDCASRGIFPGELITHHLWWHGPQWLSKSSDVWPKQKQFYGTSAEARVNSIEVLITTNEINFIDDLINRYSHFHKLIKIISLIQRFIHNLKHRETRLYGNITNQEINNAANIIYTHVQQLDFSDDFKLLSKKQHVSKSSSIKFLTPFIDENGILRVGGRLENCNISFEQKHPIILSSSSIISKMIISEYHEKYYHAGPSLLLSLLRQKYWILKAKIIIKSVIYKCIQCIRASPKLQTQLMGDLPPHRVNLIKPFLKVGVDYAGPIQAYHRRGRGQKSTKTYICIFVCVSTKAVHIELVGDLTTESFMAALRRLISRRGRCTDIYSDCGSNFLGANNQLVELYKFLKTKNNSISNSLLKEQIDWHFNPPGAPHMGGLMEAAVKSTKTHLKRVIGDTILTIEELTTLLVEIEGVLNSRPLCVLSENEIDALTPAHLIIGYPITEVPEKNLEERKISTLSRWQIVQQMKQHFSKRWQLEYLTSLQKRSKWFSQQPNLQIGDIVVIKEDSLASTKWKYGKIIDTHPGKDDLVRVVTLKTSSGVLKRPINKLCKLLHH